MFSFFKKTSDNIVKFLGKKTSKISKEKLEEVLIESDIDYEIIEAMLNNLGETVTKNELRVALTRFFRKESYYDNVKFEEIAAKPVVYLIFGVNGAGKTTTIAKLAKRFKDSNKKVILGAGDTFRAAAIEQLTLWSRKIGVDIITTKHAHDPSALAFDTINAAKSRNMDYAIIDTAGRLPNQTNLKNELIKISKTCDKALESAPFHRILILDGTQGAAGIEQAKIFHEALKLDGIIMTKMDGTSKGGAILSIIHEFRLPILFLGTGEQADEMIEFRESDFIEGLLDSIFE
ncbi:signal recognition particle-docking protein FtsY [Helicobacter muridarum]|uniref:Signal recognition particle receptor protein n=1 Tax=Helicobacter muridarum TaxID=216 RepID=A0A377PU60_9HELI|nr:signal recognition particle-docking protein FtsY [Helicobacter muridarum]TLD98667.1 signal recognition particle-docking protein FtsY [Helicobacter muridarum]STQ86386.1 signal recognition particle receptor protein [Helicobacter muridarum]